MSAFCSGPTTWRTVVSSGTRCTAGDCEVICREWEGDLMLFKQSHGQSNVTSLVERVSLFTLLPKNPNKRTKPVMGKIMKAVHDLPHLARRSITFDRGTEFVSWPHLQAEIGTQAWFCDPSSPWQNGTIENTYRRARRWLPRKRDITAVSDHELKVICGRAARYTNGSVPII
ncbi:IS30 family transposase [Rhodobacteraceae bacterium B1Z28]|uniref:IS30 family transposase n=1 Tax=Ruegeria haliotis TaxID=2747601 RepID=A0ABX2PQK5_9RHOB|nr:IS30 family transposase [Ruegeria haliotis]NVO56412.1 IS30 family transposase [Ruegeria haliotis]